jgi:hypothetical protein
VYPAFPGGVTFTVRPRASYSYSIQYTVAPGACGIDTRFTFPSAEQAHGPYSVSTTDTVVGAVH